MYVYGYGRYRERGYTIYIDDDLYNLIYPLVIVPIICFLYLRYFFLDLAAFDCLDIRILYYLFIRSILRSGQIISIIFTWSEFNLFRICNKQITLLYAWP